MAYTKSFPTEGLNGQPKWQEMVLTDQEERQEEQKARASNMMLLRQCIADSKNLVEQEGLRAYQTDVVRVALNLFQKRASHEVFWKERRCRAKFDVMVAERLAAQTNKPTQAIKPTNKNKNWKYRKKVKAKT